MYTRDATFDITAARLAPRNMPPGIRKKGANRIRANELANIHVMMSGYMAFHELLGLGSSPKGRGMPPRVAADCCHQQHTKRWSGS